MLKISVMIQSNLCMRHLKSIYWLSVILGYLVEKLNWMNIGSPSKETVEFLKGLLRLLNTNNENLENMSKRLLTLNPVY